MSISEQDVRHVARLARLAPDDGQVAEYRQQLAAILQYVEGLSKLNVEGVEALTTPLEMTGPLGDDVAKAGLTREDLLAMAPEPKSQSVDGAFVRVPKVL